jgi:hypothetical protein
MVFDEIQLVFGSSCLKATRMLSCVNSLCIVESCKSCTV